ncbi:hypothetical protein ACFQ60_00060 [Streptomyces zhihengii]
MTPSPPATQPGEGPSLRGTTRSAADDLRALCETVVRHTPATAVGEFVTDQIPAPRAALVLACVLQLSDTDDGARFWWQYAAGAGQPAAYCLYLHHLALGETHVASWWHTQTDEADTGKPASRAPRRAPRSAAPTIPTSPPSCRPVTASRPPPCCASCGSSPGTSPVSAPPSSWS